jgi:hypothetical protein
VNHQDLQEYVIPYTYFHELLRIEHRLTLAFCAEKAPSAPKPCQI